MKRVHLKVTGRVQGVGFRYHCMQEAQMLGLSGFARNLPDGSVEVEAQGDDALVEKFITAIRRGPRNAEVANIAISNSQPQIAEKGFIPR